VPATDAVAGAAPATAEVTAVHRRAVYRSSLARGDYFILRHLGAFLERTLPRLVRPGLAVADVGCGEQPLRGLLESLGARYTGIDVQQNFRGTVAVVADITSVPLPDAAFDVVVCTEVLEHVPDTAGAFAELARLCRPGGTVVVTTPFAYPLHEEPYDFVRLTPHQVRARATAAGFEVVELTCAGNELEVCATVWCNLWSRSRGARSGRMRAAWNALMRLPVNLVVGGLTPLVGSRLPRKYYLSTLAVLRRMG
jgi:SAM-dependent methyltransferase